MHTHTHTHTHTTTHTQTYTQTHKHLHIHTRTFSRSRTRTHQRTTCIPRYRHLLLATTNNYNVFFVFGYVDSHVQAMYDTLTTLLAETADQHRHAILGGDFNAQVGPRDDDEDDRTTGKFALSPTNSRGQWLKSWASTQELIITNTHFETTTDNMTTFTTPHKQPRQYDYILVQKPLWRHTHNSRATTCPDLGSDHKAVCLHLHLPHSNFKQRRRQRSHCRPSWPTDDYTRYHDQLDKFLTTNTTTDNTQNEQHQCNRKRSHHEV